MKPGKIVRLPENIDQVKQSFLKNCQIINNYAIDFYENEKKLINYQLLKFLERLNRF